MRNAAYIIRLLCELNLLYISRSTFITDLVYKMNLIIAYLQSTLRCITQYQKDEVTQFCNTGVVFVFDSASYTIRTSSMKRI